MPLATNAVRDQDGVSSARDLLRCIARHANAAAELSRVSA